MAMLDDKVEGYFLLGQNPAVGSAHGKMQRLGLAHLKWLVVRDLNLIESATFWKDGPEIETGELRTEDIGTEVFFFPAAAHVEKDGTFTQTQRMLQWHHKAVEPPGDARSELQFFYHLGRKIRERLAGSTDERDRPLLDLTWDYPRRRARRARPPRRCCGRSTGSTSPATRPASRCRRFTEMKADGSTAGGCWIYSGVYADGVNQAARRKPGREQSWVAPEWGWAWPTNRRILYNRASADPDGKPWSERKAYVWWDEEQGSSGPGTTSRTSRSTRPPSYRPPEGAGGPDGPAPATTRSSCRPTARAGCTRPTGLLDGPLPAHYEPQESPVSNPLYRQQANPTRAGVPAARTTCSNPSGDEPGAEVFPYVFTTYRLTEHHTAGGMSRWLPYLSELQPEFFCEVSPELARERGLEHGGWATIVTRPDRDRGAGAGHRADRAAAGRRPDDPPGRPALPLGVGGDAVVTGDSANDLFGVTLDPNVHIQESKVASCDIRPGRRPRGPALLEFVEDYRGGPASRSRPATPSAPPAGVTAAAPGRLREGTHDIDRASAWSGPPARRPGPARDAGWEDAPPRMGFFTDTSICIGCKACEVACKEWNGIPEDGFDLLGTLLRQHRRARRQHLAARRLHRAAQAARAPETGVGRPPVDLGMPSSRLPLQPATRPPAGRRRRHPHHGRRATGVPLADVLRRLQALHPRRLPRRLPDRRRCSAPSSAPSSCRTTSATAAATACRPARTA